MSEVVIQQTQYGKHWTGQVSRQSSEDRPQIIKIHVPTNFYLNSQGQLVGLGIFGHDFSPFEAALVAQLMEAVRHLYDSFCDEAE